MKGQVSVEMLLVIGLGIAIVSIYLIYSYQALGQYSKGNDEFLMKDSLQKISQTAKFVGLQGMPARQTINICFPVSFSNCTVSGYFIDCQLHDGTQISQAIDTNLSGILPNSSGCWNIALQAENNVVNITVS